MDELHPTNVAFIENIDRDLQKARIQQRSFKIVADEDEAAPTTTKAAVDIKRIESQTRKIDLQIAELTGEMVQRDMVKRLFGGMTSVILNLFFPISDRLSPIVCGACGVTDQIKILEVKAIIDKEIMRGLSEFKQQSEAEL